MSTPDKPIRDRRFKTGDRYQTDTGMTLVRDPAGRWFTEQKPRLWVLSDHHMEHVSLDADGCWRTDVEAKICWIEAHHDD